jgi:hypothetical protein
MLLQNGASTLTVGHATNGTATLNIRNGGTFVTATGAIAINATGRVNMESGAVLRSCFLPQAAQRSI